MTRKIDSGDSGLGEEEDYNDGGWTNEELSESYGSEDGISDDDDIINDDCCESLEKEEPGDEGSSRNHPKRHK